MQWQFGTQLSAAPYLNGGMVAKRINKSRPVLGCATWVAARHSSNCRPDEKKHTTGPYEG
jgi:hypothetical protein